MKQKLTILKKEIDNSAIRVEDFNASLSIIDRTTRQKISKDIEDLNNPVSQLDIIYIYRTLNQTTHSFQAHMEHSPG